MADNSIVNILINIAKHGKGDEEAIKGLKKLSTGFKQLTGINLSSLTTWAMVGAAVAKVVDYTKKAVESNVAYVTTVEDIVRLTGMQAEEASRLYQVTDDLFIPQEKFTQAMQYAIKNGFEPTVENIKNVADEYNAISDPADKARFAMELFGKKAGPEMQKLLEQGSKAIGQKMDAVSKALVVDEAAIKITKAYKQSVDTLNDSLDGIAYSVAQGTMPAMTDFNNELAGFVETVNESEIVSRALNAALEVGSKALMFWDGIIAGDIRYWIDYTGILQDAGKATKELGKSSDESSEYLDELNESAKKLTDSFKPLTNEIIFNSLASSLDSQGQLTLARHLGLIDEASYNATLQLQGLTDEYDLNRDGVIDLEEQTSKYWEAIKKVTDTAGTYHWDFVVTTNSIMAPASVVEAPRNPTTTASGKGKIPGAATGGLVKVGEHGTEIVALPDGSRVYNNNETMQMLGGQQNITINVNGAKDVREVANEIARILNRQNMGRS